MLFHAFSCIQYNLMISTSYSSSHPSGSRSTCPSYLYVFFFSDLVSPVSDAQMCMGVGHPWAHGQPTSGHTLEEDSPFPSSCQLPRTPYQGWEFMSPCLVHAGVWIGLILCMPCVGTHCYCSWVCECQVLSRRQRFSALTDILQLLPSFSPLWCYLLWVSGIGRLTTGLNTQ